MENYFLKTKRIGFSTWSMDKLPDAQKLWGDPKVTEYIVSGGTMTEDQITQRLQREMETFNKYKIQYYPIYLLDTSENIGCCGLRPYDDGILELGIHLKSQHWGKGYAQEAGSAIINYAFTTIKTKALFAGHNPNNTASKKILEKLGFQYTHEEYYPPTGLNHPSYILKGETLPNNMT